MVDIFAGWFSALGLSETFDLVLANIVVGIIMIVVAFLSKFLFEKLLIKPIEIIVRKSAFKWDDHLIKHKLLYKIALMIPAIVIALFARAFPAIEGLIYKLVTTYLIFISAVVVDAFLDVFTSAYQSLETSRDKPIKSYMTVVKIMIYIVAGVIAVSVLTEISPWGILSGIGAMTAVLLVVFRDSLLGLVASIQISKNNLVSIGDWIEVPKFQADGDVIDITLTTIRIQNWDKTITTIPSYVFTSAYQSLETSRDKPIKSYMTVVKIMIYIVAGVIAVSVLTEISPWGILSGIGAMTAVLLVFFRGSLLGLVSSLQMSKNNLVK
ncbi:mechanosensitive ion channel domain-containing protein, partial [Mesotoga sp.]|uniref:mechanosensitive ion channel family protein n=1 Tax=Mesotoga sp. TaxID=2053577 RepID=UPI00263110AF